MQDNTRLYYIDWIKIIIVLSLVPFHAAVSFNFTGIIAIHYPQNVPVLRYSLWFMDLWNMLVLFLLSGMNSFYSLKNRTAGKFMLERCKRLLIPFIAGFFIICPVVSYYRALFIGKFDGNIIGFYPHFFDGMYPNGNNFIWHFWFLIFLFIFTLILLPVFLLLKKDTIKIKLISGTKIFEKNFCVYLFTVPLIIILIFYQFLLPPTAVFDMLKHTFYFYAVFMGFMFALNSKIVENIQRIRFQTLIIGSLLFIIFVIGSMTDAGKIIFRIYNWLYIFAAFSWILTILGYMKKLFNIKNRIYDYLNNSSFPFYAFHFLTLTILTFYFIKEDFNMWLKYFIIVIGSYAFTFLLYEVVRRIPYFRFLFGIKGTKQK